jgi:heme/copper-type cytochrome/quinol oxidase subunit 4
MRIEEVGYRSGMTAAAASSAFAIVQLMQVAGWLSFPADEILIYGTSLCIVIPFVLEMAAFHHLSQGDARFWTLAALLWTVVYAVFVTSNYVVQLATVIPARLQGSGDAVQLLNQTPHSMFWDFDAIGYLAMGLVTLLAIPAVGRTGFDRKVRLALIAHTVMTPVIGIVYFAPSFSNALLMVAFPWAITAPVFMAMLALRIRRA